VDAREDQRRIKGRFPEAPVPYLTRLMRSLVDFLEASSPPSHSSIIRAREVVERSFVASLNDVMRWVANARGGRRGGRKFEGRDFVGKSAVNIRRGGRDIIPARSRFLWEIIKLLLV
jgi:hypothetical protein